MTDNLPVAAGTTPLEALAQAHEVEALSFLVETLRDPEAKRDIRLKAAQELLDRARGKPRVHQQKDPTQRKSKAIALSVDQLLKIVQKAGERVAHSDAIRKQADVLEGEFVPVVRKRPINEYAQVQAIVPGTTEIDELLK